MPNVEKISIALPHDMVAIIKSAVETGQYATTSELVREALRDWKMKRTVQTLELEDLRRLIQEGIDSGPSGDGDEIFARLRGKYTAMLHGNK